MSSAVQSMYSLALTTNSSTYSRDCVKSNYYYEAKQVNVVEAGYYTFGIKNNFDIVGYLYQDSFNPLNPFKNFLTRENFGCGNRYFILKFYFQVDTVYVLVISAFMPNVTGNFLVTRLVQEISVLIFLVSIFSICRQFIKELRVSTIR